ncbi:MAG: phosphoribosylamine--glycine ligase [Candidatus Hydrogenedentes bacterium]|jgi:phosphoribosylamine--glycine ligase|nr:phosphoribosylamine--glycine ligase [Candidatus Hydrogenedentota bacterium]
MNVMVIGSGGREHALAWKIAQSPLVKKVYGAPGNPGIDALEKGICVNVAIDDFDLLSTYAEIESISLIVVGPEAPLAEGIVDTLGKRGFAVFGPSKAAAQLEASKSFAKAFMERHKIPTAAYHVFDDAQGALDFLKTAAFPLVIKADGLAAGKGVSVVYTLSEAEEAVRAAMLENVFDDAGARIVIEDYLEGEEASILALCDGKNFKTLATSQDHKPALDGDKGPNTGGMGAYSPAPVVSDALMEVIRRDILAPSVAGMAAEGNPYRGILYAGLMITAEGPKVIEFNVRFGDPETQAILPRMTSDIVPLLQSCCDGSLAAHDIAYSPSPCVSVVMASGGYPGAYAKGKAITGIANAETIDGVTVFMAGVRQQGDTLLTAGGRVLNVTATAPTHEEAVRKAYAAVERIHFEGVQYRSDIGKKAYQHLTENE